MNALEVVQAWENAVNCRDAEVLLEHSAPDIEIVGPRGSAHGHALLREWLGKAGLSLEPERYFAREGRVAVLGRGIWRSVETGEQVGEGVVASAYRVQGEQVAFYARFDALELALERLGLHLTDEVQVNA